MPWKITFVWEKCTTNNNIHTNYHNRGTDMVKVKANEAMARLKNIAKSTRLIIPILYYAHLYYRYSKKKYYINVIQHLQNKVVL